MELFPKKPKFSQRLVARKQQDEKELRGVSLSFRFAKGVLSTLADYVYLSRLRREEPYPLLKLQLHLLLDLILWEDAVSKYKRQKQAAEARVSADSKDDEAKNLVEALEAEIVIHQHHLRAIRDIGDGIAWRLFGYDRAVLYTLADRPARKHIDLRGLQAEGIEFETKFDSLESITVMNDLTHCLKIGDLTTRRGSDTFELTEVKSNGKKSGRITRQRQALRETVEFLNDGSREERGFRLEIRELNLAPKTHFTDLRALIETAGTEGAAWKAFDDILTVACLDIPKAVEFGKEKTKAILDAANASALAPEAKGEQVFFCPSTDRYRFVRNYAPYSIYPIPDLARVKLATGAMVLFQYLNLSAFMRFLKSKGWECIKPLEEFVKEAGEDKEPEAVAIVKKGPLALQIPWTWVGRLWIEFTSAETVLDILEATSKEGSSAPTLALSNLKGEATIWD
jgi:hypothetical protein